MRKHLLVFIFLTCCTIVATAQGGKGIRIGYIDMEYILQSVPDYAEANNQLDQKAQKWKQELEVKNNEIEKLKESLKIEKALLTKELLDEREEAIRFWNQKCQTYNKNILAQKVIWWFKRRF